MCVRERKSCDLYNVQECTTVFRGLEKEKIYISSLCLGIRRSPSRTRVKEKIWKSREKAKSATRRWRERKKV